MKGYSQQLQFIHDCELFIISFNCACHDFNFGLNFCAVIKFRAKLKIAQLANFLSCRDIRLFVATYLTSGGTSHPLAATSNISSLC